MQKNRPVAEIATVVICDAAGWLLAERAYPGYGPVGMVVGLVVAMWLVVQLRQDI